MGLLLKHILTVFAGCIVGEHLHFFIELSDKFLFPFGEDRFMC